MMNKDVFISYKAEEINEANWVKSILESHGISCWIAPDDIPPGSNYTKEIAGAIKSSKVFLLLLSQSAQSSVWIPKELDTAINAEKIIMPYMIEDCSISGFEFYLSDVQIYEAYKDKNETVQRLVTEIKNYIDRQDSQDAQTAIFTDEFKKAVSSKANSFCAASGRLLKKHTAKLSPYTYLTTGDEYLSMHIITAVMIFMFLYIFIGLTKGSNRFIFPFIFSFVLILIFWNIGSINAKLIGKRKSKVTIVMLSVISAVGLSVAALISGAYVAELLSEVAYLR